MLIFFAFAVLDLLAGLMLWQTGWFPGGWIQTVGWLVLLKAAYSLWLNFADHHYTDVLGFIDLTAAMLLLAGWSVPWFWVAPVAKGLYSLLHIYGRWK